MKFMERVMTPAGEGWLIGVNPYPQGQGAASSVEDDGISRSAAPLQAPVREVLVSVRREGVAAGRNLMFGWCEVHEEAYERGGKCGKCG